MSIPYKTGLLTAKKGAGFVRDKIDKKIYLDYAAATPTEPQVVQAIKEGYKFYGNPSSYNDAGRMAGRFLEKARNEIANFLHASGDEIVFTGSGSESNNLALFGLAKAHPNQNEIITTPTEHLSVLECIKKLEKKGVRVHYAPVNSEGFVRIEDVVKLINSKTLLVSVMYANNEIGSIQPIAKLGRAIRRIRENSSSHYPFFHTDACQAAGYLDMNVQNLGVDLLTMNGSKIYGPRGIGVLFVRKGIQMEGLILGGQQENRLRAGTENLPAILGLAKAIQCLDHKESTRLKKLRDYFFKVIQKSLPEISINGPMGDGRLANNINISIPGLGSEYLLLELDKHGIHAGSGSACTARAVEPSHVLSAIGVKDPYLEGALRFSMGKQTTKHDIDVLLTVLPRVINKLRKRFAE